MIGYILKIDIILVLLWAEATIHRVSYTVVGYLYKEGRICEYRV